MVGPISATYAAVNRGKEILSLNLKDDADRERFFESGRAADVVLEGFRPGVIEKLGIGYAQLSAINPRLVLCSISGYGQVGPYAQRAGHDLNYQALAGVLSISGGDATSPANPPLQVADTASGSYAAAMLVVAALFERQTTGRGRHIDVSMSEQLLPLMTTLYAAAGQETDPRRDGECSVAARLATGSFAPRTANTSRWRAQPKFWSALVAPGHA